MRSRPDLLTYTERVLIYYVLIPSVQAKHTQENSVSWGVDGETGCLSDMSVLGIWEPLAVKAQTYKTAVEVRNHPLINSYLITDYSSC